MPRLKAPRVDHELLRLQHGLDVAAKAYGSKRNLARALGLARERPHRWNRGIPLGRVDQIHADTGIPKSVLRPDKYGIGAATP